MNPDECTAALDELLGRIEFATLAELRSTIKQLDLLVLTTDERGTRPLLGAITELLAAYAAQHDLDLDDELQSMIEDAQSE